MRVKKHIDPTQLADAVNKVEGGKNPPNNLVALYKEVGKLLGETPSVVMGRIRDYQIVLKTQPGRKGRPERDGEDKPQQISKNEIAISVSNLTPFTSRGITVSDITDIMTSAVKDDETNQKIRAAWSEIRRKTGHAKP